MLVLRRTLLAVCGVGVLAGLGGPAHAADPGVAVNPWGDVTRAVSVSADGSSIVPAGGSVDRDLVVSAGGRYVAFASASSKLVKGDSNGVSDVFVRDLAHHVTHRVSVSSDEDEANQPSAERYGAIGLDMSSDGRYVVFTSDATNLVPNDTNGAPDIFLRDRLDGTTTMVTVPAPGSPGFAEPQYPVVGADGQRVAFIARAVGEEGSSLFVWNGSAAIAEPAVGPSAGGVDLYEDLAMSVDGRFIAMCAASMAPDDYFYGTYVYDVDRSVLELVSVSNTGQPVKPGGCESSPDVSADGRFVVFEAYGYTRQWPNGVYVHDRVSGKTELIVAPTNVYDVGISPNGQLVVDASRTGLYGGDGEWVDVNVTNRITDRTRAVSVTYDNQRTGSSWSPDVSRRGEVIVFSSSSASRMTRALPGTRGIFVRRVS